MEAKEVTKSLRFYCDEDGWFANIPEWDGEKADLAMVLGADTMLDIFAQGTNEVRLTFSNTPFKEGELQSTLTKTDQDEFGATYALDKVRGVDMEFPVWLCNVTIFVMGDFPEKIYIL